MSALLPEGWAVEPEDRSAGILGDYYWHDACPVDPDDEADLTEERLERLDAQAVRVRATLRCRSCGATAEWTYSELDPEEPPAPPMAPEALVD